MFWSTQAYAKSFMPPAASTFAGDVDAVYKFLMAASVISSILVIGGMIYFVLKYRRRTNNDKTAYIAHGTVLEFLWSFIPFVIFMVVFGWSWHVYYKMRVPPKNSMEVNVVGQKWNWNFLYKSGRTSGELYVPVNQPVRLIMGSRDVIHSFYIPSFRTKQDVVPGRYTALWFEADKVGDYQVFCTEFCGDGHSAMLTKIHVLPRDKFEEWMENDPYKGMSLVEVGKAAFQKCTACHNITSDRKVGPGLAGVFGHEVEIEGGSPVVADENYIRESILNPAAQIVKGYPNAMTPFQGQLTEQELLGLVEYIKSLQ